MKPTMWKFTQVNQEENKSTETTVFLSPDASWDEIMPHFASFLEGTGYGGAFEKLERIGAFDLLQIFNRKHHDSLDECNE